VSKHDYKSKDAATEAAVPLEFNIDILVHLGTAVDLHSCIY
jgi:hypothetical protein